MLILGIDPGTATTGYGLIKIEKNKPRYVKCGVIKTSKKDHLGKRLLLLRKELKKIIKNNRPSCLVLEKLFFGRNAQTAMMVSSARGVVMMVSAESHLPLFEYQGLTVKKHLTTNGRAPKKEMQKKVKSILKMDLLPKPDDAADALAIAIYHAFRLKP